MKISRIRYHAGRASLNLLPAIVVSCGLASTATAYAQSQETNAALPALGSYLDEQPRLRLDGFGTIGYTHWDNNRGWSFTSNQMQRANDSSGSFYTESKLGLQGSYRISDHFDLTGQAVLKQQGEFAPWHQNIQWATINWRPTPDWQIRLGRSNPDFFMLTDYRNVNFAYPWLRPNVEQYGFDTIAAVEGLDVIKVINDEGRRWRLRFGFGRSSTTLGNLQAHDEGRNTVGSRNGALFVVEREYQGLTLRASYLRAKIKATPSTDTLRDSLASLDGFPVEHVAEEAAAYEQETFRNGTIQTYTSVGLLFDRNDWLIQSEASLLDAEFKKAMAATRAYAYVGKRIGPATVYFGMGRVKPRASAAKKPTDWEASITPVMGPEAAAQIAALGDIAYSTINSFRFDQRTTTLGLRYDLTPTLALNLQWDRTRIFSNGGASWGNADLQDARADVVAATMSFVF